jgi:cellulose synthase/poly-beta-1,6-N-acetylglucosamine synthase-like glycosyltransferase
MWATLIFVGTAAVFLAMTIATLWHIRWVRRLPTLKTLTAAPTTSRIKCSIVIAARDEAARIEQTLRRLLAQRGVELELFVVDDRSTDGTSEILRELARDDARVRVKRVDVLPDGWLG